MSIKDCSSSSSSFFFFFLYHIENKLKLFFSAKNFIFSSRRFAFLTLAIFQSVYIYLYDRHCSRIAILLTQFLLEVFLRSFLYEPYIKVAPWICQQFYNRFLFDDTSIHSIFHSKCFLFTSMKNVFVVY